MASIKVTIKCVAIEMTDKGEIDPQFDGHYVFDCPKIKGEIDLYETGDVPHFLQDRGLLASDADIHVGDNCTITLWEGNDSEFISRFGSLEPFNPAELNDDSEMPEGLYDFVERLWEDFWSRR